MHEPMGARKLETNSTRLIAGTLILILGGLLWWLAQDEGAALPKTNEGRLATSATVHRTLDLGEKEIAAPTRALRLKGPSAPTSNPRRLRVRVVDATGQPLEKVPVLLVDGGGHRDWRRTDPAGLAVFDHPETGHLLTRALSQPPVIQKVTREREDYVLRLAGGFHIEGQLLVNGTPPGETLDFSASVFQSGLTDRFFRAIHRATHDSDMEPIPLRCDESGAFRIDGLQAGWAVRINLPKGLRMMQGEKDGGRPTVHIDTVRSGGRLVLRTTRRSLIEGFCLNHASLPLSNIPVHVRVVWKSLSKTTRHLKDYDLLHSDSNGHFAVWMDTHLMHRILFVASWAGIELTQEAVPSIESTQQILPSFVFPAARKVCIQVVDEGRQPVHRAKVGTTDGTLILTTDATGGVSLPLIPGELLSVHVAAKGFEMRELAIPGVGETNLNVEMKRAHRATLSFHWDDESPVRARLVILTFPTNPFQNDSIFSSPIHAALDRGVRMTRWKGLYVVSGKTDEKGLFTIDDLTPGARIHVELRGAGGGKLLDEERSITGARDEQITFVVDRKLAKTLKGVVLDVHGNPVSDAAILIGQNPNRLARKAYTDGQGRFRIRDVVFETGYIQAVKPGFRKATRLLENLRDPVETLSFRLAPGAHCKLVVEDSEGHLLGGASVDLPYVAFPGAGPVCLKQGDGTFEIVDIGDEPCHPVIYGPGGKKRKITIRPDIDVLRVVRWD
ncbi:MAG TPA: carboxypeptidase regulatory-like domain-containing protein [Planctomycetes bacterium]|nr:carboxypeptidase regulatory-like domain-containing protein [Planctomycetota bacterium]